MYARRLFLIGSIAVLIYLSIRMAPAAQAPMNAFASSIQETPHKVSVGWVGDIVPSADTHAFDQVRDSLLLPDLMIGNLEGTFALPERESKCVVLMTMCHAFRGDPSFAQALKDAGFDFVSLVNNHSYDYGRDGLLDTEQVLDEAGIPYISPTKPSTSIVVKNIRIGILGLSSTEPASTITDYDFITREVGELKSTNDFVIVLFHGGAEGVDKTDVPGETEYMGNENRGNVELVAHTAVNAGADLILGAGPHVLRKIEVYKDKPIAYSLGNFYGGTGELITTGTLGISAIFHTILGDQQTWISSVLLSPTGTPSLDFTNQGLQLIESLSK